MIHLRPADEADLFDSESFILPREYRCVGLSSRLIREGRIALPPRSEGTLWLLKEEEKGRESIAALFLATSTSMLYHCVREGFDLRAGSSLIRRKLLDQGISCAIGSGEHSVALETISRVKARHAVDYDLMTLTATRGPLRDSAVSHSGSSARSGAANPEILLRPADRGDLELLFPLQAGYEQEEVLLPGEPFMADRCRSLLRITLTAQRVYLARDGDKAVAKAGTNARGLSWDQIGGVYTLPEYRKKGYGKAVMSILCDNRLSEGRNLALFVKNGNFSAKKLYEVLGFASRERFRIVYW